MKNNKNRFEEDKEEHWIDDLHRLLDADDEDDINVFDIAKPTIENPKLDCEKHELIAACLQSDDHGLTYAIVYSHLFLIASGEAKSPENGNWRFAFNDLLPFECLIRFYRLRRDAPTFIRDYVKSVLKSVGWIDTCVKQAKRVEQNYLALEIASRKFISKLHGNNLLTTFLDQCKFNYDQILDHASLMDREELLERIVNSSLPGVIEIKRTIAPLEVLQENESVQWVQDEVQERTRGKENSRFLELLFTKRYKPRLQIDEAVFSELDARFPNFIEVITYYKAQFRLNLLTGRDYIPPILLLGSPGIGKTAFAKSLAHAFNTGYTFIDMASASANWILSGLSTSWNGAKPGKLVTAMLESPTASPIVLLDEVEKASPNSHGQDPRTPLYQLLEENTARTFTDEFVDFPVDLSRIIYIACANSTEGLTEPLLTRFKIMEIPDPSDEEHDMIVDSIYQAEVVGSTAFPAHLPREIKHLLRGTSLRESKVMISDAIATALLEVTLNQMKDRTKLRLELLPEYFKFKTVQKKKMGF
jgi:hypothetical protein